MAIPRKIHRLMRAIEADGLVLSMTSRITPTGIVYDIDLFLARSPMSRHGLYGSPIAQGQGKSMAEALYTAYATFKKIGDAA